MLSTINIIPENPPVEEKISNKVFAYLVDSSNSLYLLKYNVSIEYLSSLIEPTYEIPYTSE
jgi:hypothetical protein